MARTNHSGAHQFTRYLHGSRDPSTVETFTVLHSSEAPETFSTDVDLPAGHRLVEVEDGLVAVVSGDDAPPVMFIEAPWAIDANGRSVPLALSIDGDDVVLHVAHHESSEIAYPVLADPIWYYAGYGYRLNNAEYDYCKWPSRWGLCWTIFRHGDVALDAAKATGLPGLKDGRGDAFRHCYWSARMTIGHGVDKAREFGERHEDGSAANERQMDSSNNGTGRSIGITTARDPQNSYSWANLECKIRAERGELLVINNQGKVVRG